MVQANEEHVARRLAELLGWADYMVESLSMDQRYEKGKVDELRRMIGETGLSELRQAAWALRGKLDYARIQAEHRVPSPAH